MDPVKVKAIEDWEEPQTVHDVRVFLGLANYYHKFVEGYSKIVALLTDLLKRRKHGTGQRGASLCLES
jgi:hypothetical protein